jgi:alpha-L-arabinofuranosidase
MSGLALHYYCGTGEKSRSATNFGEDDWFALLRKAQRMEQLVSRHSQIMNTYDLEKRVALVVDEWGAWHQVEPGSNPGFLYQQNALRDALVAGLTLNIFNRHCDRVRMANIAQTVNVLQAMILTDKAKILLTPTYHVFEMYSVHHDATLLPADLSCENYHLGQQQIPAISASASRDKAGKIHITLCNLNPIAAAEIHCQLEGSRAKSISGRVLTAREMQAHNTFDAPETIKPSEFREFTPTDEGFTTSLRAKSVVVLELE